MEADVKVKIAEISMNLLFQHGIPALIKFVNLLGEDRTITVDEIIKLKKNLDAGEYFK